MKPLAPGKYRIEKYAEDETRFRVTPVATGVNFPMGSMPKYDGFISEQFLIEALRGNPTNLPAICEVHVITSESQDTPPTWSSSV